MKLIHISIGLNVGGAEATLKKLLENTHGAKQDHSVISLTGIGTIGLELKQKGFSVYSLGLNPVNFLYVFYQLIKLIRTINPDIVQTWMYHADLLGGVAARVAGCSHVVWGIRNSNVPYGNRLTFIIMKVSAWLSGFISQKIICVADCAKRIHVKSGYKEQNMVVIPNGYDFSVFSADNFDSQESKETLKLPLNSVVLGCVGRFHMDKGQDIIIECMGLLIQKYPDLILVLIGKGCDLNNSLLTSLLRKEKLEKSVILLGERSDIPFCLSAIDIFCMPSRTEGFPNGLVEAMAMEKYCVATDVGDAKKILSDTGIISDVTVSSIVKSLSVAIDMDKMERNKKAGLSKIRVNERYSIQKMVNNYQIIYENLLEK